MKGEPWHKRYHRRTLDKYRALEPALRGIAYTLLDLIYDNGGPLYRTDQMIAGDLVISQRLWRSAKVKLIEAGFFYLDDDGGLTNGTCEDVLAEWKKHARNGSVGGRTRAENARNSANQGRTDFEVSKNYNESNADVQARLDDGFNHRDVEVEKSSEVPNGTSGAETPSKNIPVEVPKPRPGDNWTIAAEMLNPTDPGWKAPEKSDLWTSARNKGVRKFQQVVEIVKTELGANDQRVPIVLGKVVAAALEHSAPDVGYMIQTARGVMRDMRKNPDPKRDADQDEAFIGADGRAWIRDRKTGAERPLVPARAVA